MNTTRQDSHGLLFLHGREVFAAKPDEIIRLEARSNYTRVYFVNHAPVLMAKVLRCYEEILLPYGFLRTHRSHLVNLRYVSHVDKETGITMHDTSCAGISRRRKRHVFRSIGKAGMISRGHSTVAEN